MATEKPSITRIGALFYEIDADEGAFKVSFMFPDGVILYSPELVQKFKHSFVGVSPKTICRYFNSMDRIEKAAEYYKEGRADKNALMKSANEFVMASRLPKSKADILTNFISSTTAIPPAIREQLTILGFGEFERKASFEEPLPELILSCKLFFDFCKKFNTLF